LLILMMALIAIGFCGCKSTEPENESARPWNSPPRGWEGGGVPGFAPNSYRR
jgi:hypothetical protein